MRQLFFLLWVRIVGRYIVWRKLLAQWIAGNRYKVVPRVEYVRIRQNELDAAREQREAWTSYNALETECRELSTRLYLISQTISRRPPRRKWLAMSRRIAKVATQ